MLKGPKNMFKTIFDLRRPSGPNKVPWTVVPKNAKLVKIPVPKIFSKIFFKIYLQSVSKRIFGSSMRSQIAQLWVSCQRSKMVIFNNFCRNFCVWSLSALRLKSFTPTSTYESKLTPQSIFQ